MITLTKHLTKNNQLIKEQLICEQFYPADVIAKIYNNKYIYICLQQTDLDYFSKFFVLDDNFNTCRTIDLPNSNHSNMFCYSFLLIKASWIFLKTYINKENYYNKNLINSKEVHIFDVNQNNIINDKNNCISQKMYDFLLNKKISQIEFYDKKYFCYDEDSKKFEIVKEADGEILKVIDIANLDNFLIDSNENYLIVISNGYTKISFFDLDGEQIHEIELKNIPNTTRSKFILDLQGNLTFVSF